MLDLRRLQALHAVVEAGTVKDAAARLGYTPSAVSQHVSALERETGALLLEPAGRGVRPTAAGELLARHAALLLAGSAAAEAELAALNAGELGTLRMASFATAGAELVPPALARVRAALPNVEIGLRVAEREDAISLLARGMLDLAVVEAHDDQNPAPGDLVTMPLLADPFRLVVPRGHRLASRRSVALADTAGEEWVDILCEVGCCRAATTAAFTAAGFEPHRVVEADEYWPAQGFVAAGLGLALVPALALGVQHRGVAVRPLRRSDQPVRQVLAVARRSTAGTAPVAAMVEALRLEAGSTA